MQHKKHNQGVSLYLAIVVLSIMTAALLSLMALSISQTSIIFTLGDSVLAFYGADTGAERVLYKAYQDMWVADAVGDPVYPALPPPDWESSLSNNVLYQVFVSDFATTSFWAIGNYRDTKRAIQVSIGN